MAPPTPRKIIANFVFGEETGFATDGAAGLLGKGGGVPNISLKVGGDGVSYSESDSSIAASSSSSMLESLDGSCAVADRSTATSSTQSETAAHSPSRVMRYPLIQQSNQTHDKVQQSRREAPLWRGGSRYWPTALCFFAILIMMASSGPAQTRGSGEGVKNRAAALFRQAKEAKDAGNWKEVIAKATAALELEPEYADAFEVRASARLKTKDYSGAVADYTAVLERQPHRSVARFMRAGALMKSGDAERAIDDYTALIDSDQAASLHPRYARSMAYIKVQRISEAVEDLEAEIDSFPHELPRLGDLFLQVDRAPYAARCYSLAIVNSLNSVLPSPSIQDQQTYWDSGLESAVIADHILKGDDLNAIGAHAQPARRRSWELREGEEFQFGREGDELTLIEQIRKAPPQDATFSAVGDLYARRAKALFQSEQVRDAICDLNESVLCTSDKQSAGTRAAAEIVKHSQAILDMYYTKKPVPNLDALVPTDDDRKALAFEELRWTPQEVGELVQSLEEEMKRPQAPPEVSQHYAMLCLASDQTHLAENAFRLLLDKEPSVQLLRFSAEAAMRLKQYRPAGAACTKLINLSAADPRIYEIRACAYLAIGERERAVTDFVEVIRQVSESFEYIAPRDSVRDAAEAARKVIEHTSAEIDSQEQRGSVNFDRRAEAYTVLGDYKRALADYNQAQKLATPGYYSSEIGRCLLALGDARRALVAFREDAEQGDSEGLLGRAQCLAAMGEYRESVADFEAAMKSDPENGRIYSDLASVFMELEDLDKALQVAEAGRALSDWDGMDVSALAGVYAARKDYKEAAFLQRRALERTETDESALKEATLLGSYLVETGEVEQLTDMVAIVTQRAARRKELADRARKSEQDWQRTREDAEKNRNPYKDLSR